MIDIKQAREVLAKATEPPWHRSGDTIIQTAHITRDVWTIPQTLDDIDAIAYAHNNMPAMIDWIEAAVKCLEDVMTIDATYEFHSDAAALLDKVSK